MARSSAARDDIAPLSGTSDTRSCCSHSRGRDTRRRSDCHGTCCTRTRCVPAPAGDSCAPSARSGRTSHRCSCAAAYELTSAQITVRVLVIFTELLQVLLPLLEGLLPLVGHHGGQVDRCHRVVLDLSEERNAPRQRKRLFGSVVVHAVQGNYGFNSLISPTAEVREVVSEHFFAIAGTIALPEFDERVVATNHVRARQPTRRSPFPTRRG